ncbi:hypothetical protein D9615_001057 [Tricholomella constricta]|uniref:YjgF-like protein n=1 Tax=Tricholomella constricta TaxID=117010 RepID=A0A8H5HK14_9AGAR|nr:hypothetical protein D9615_001057 [Tricholomella constricta]
MLSRTFALYNRTFRASTLKAALSQTPLTYPVRHFHRTHPAMSTVKTHSSLTVVSTPNAPAAIGPYAQAIKAGDLLFLSGCIPLNAQGQLVGEGDVTAQTHQVLANLKAVVEAGGSELGKVIKTTVFLKSMNDFATVNGIYSSFFGQHTPARSAVEVARLPKDVLVEIEAIVSLK